MTFAMGGILHAGSRQDAITNSVDMCLSKLWEMVKDREAWRAAVCEIVGSRTRLND